MVAFLTSSFIPYTRVPGKKTPLMDENGFRENLKKYWPEHAHFLFVVSDPEDAVQTQRAVAQVVGAFTDSGFLSEDVTILDRSNSSRAAQLVRETNVLYLSGGHAPTENAFIGEIGLRELLKDYQGLFIGLSAGALNAADETLQIPELPGESLDPAFPVHLPGLGITSLHIVPHAAYFRTLTLDGKSYYDDILLPLSHGNRIYFIDDGSYFLIDDGVCEFYGTGEIIEDGAVRRISSVVEPEIWKAVMAQGYGCAFVLDSETASIEFKHISPFLKQIGISPAKIRDFPTLIRTLSERLVVEEEKQPVIDQTSMECILGEVTRFGSFSRTVHFMRKSVRNSADLRIRRIGDNLFGYIFNITEAIDRDWMTDIFSRTGFIRELENFLSETEDPTRYSLIYTNIKGFKTINDLFGQQSGDMVIFTEKDAVYEAFDPVFIGRLENDHFILLVENSHISEEKFRSLAQLTYTEKYKKYTFTIRCGLARILSRDEQGSDLIDRARMAEKNIRDESARNWEKFEAKTLEIYTRNGEFVSELSDAVKSGEFKTYYQPIVDTRSRKIVTAESLIRWEHRRLGLIPPAEFVPLFEKEGKIPILDTFMLKNVEAFQSGRFAEGKHIVPVSVNLSRIDFFDTLLLEDIRTLLASSTMPADMVKLEVTESAYADIEERAIGFLRDMKAMGVKILLDDYGSGMSSLSTLETFAFDTVKLDKGFIRKIGKSSIAESIIRSTIKLSHDIGSDVIAEGVETEEQVAFLQDAGCEMIQGYYFYKPIPQEAFAGLLDKETLQG